jgi:hypothetical protein
MGLVGDPRIVFLDEPTAGLDPRSRRTMWQDIRELVAGGVTVFLTTQYLEEADRLADRIALLDHGRLVAEGTPEELKRLVPGGHISLEVADLHGLESAAHALGEVVRDDEALTLQVPGDGGVRSLRALLDRLDGASIEVASLSVHTPDLDDVFLALTGRPDKEEEGARAMSTLSYAVADSAAMLRRDLRHALRYPSISWSACRLSSCCCLSTSSAARWVPGSAHPAAGPPTSSTSLRGSCC